MHKTTLYGIALFFLVLVGGFFFVRGSPGGASGAVVALDENAEVQEVVLSYKNNNYFPATIEVTAGTPVRLSLDKSVTGCFRDFTMRELNIREYLRTPSDSVTFIPPAPGTYAFACSMGMGSGKLVAK